MTVLCERKMFDVLLKQYPNVNTKESKPTQHEMEYIRGI
jgi:hypothetical protein